MTEERKSKFKKAIAKRQPNLTIVMEDIRDPHNIAAVLRSCDSVGVQEVFIINPEAQIIGRKSSGSANKWLDMRFYTDVESCYKAVRKKYDKIYTTHLSEDAVSLYEMDLTQSVALVFGNEQIGNSKKAVELADGNFIIPQVGLIQSLNISVACAVTLYEAYRQRAVSGNYENSLLSETEQAALFEEWIER